MFSSYGGEKVPYSREIVSKEFLRYYMLFMLASFGNISDDGIARLTKKSFEKVLKTYLSTNSPYKKNIHKMGKKLLITDVELKDFLDNGKLCNAMSDSLVEYATTYFSENYTMPPLSVLPYNAHI
jgi:hypothetical protein